jgi:NAD-dependent SIR2 family protein deacetylase
MTAAPKPKRVPVVTVRCIQCGATKDVRAGEVDDDDVPLCDQCYMPMLPVSGRVKR